MHQKMSSLNTPKMKTTSMYIKESMKNRNMKYIKYKPVFIP